MKTRGAAAACVAALIAAQALLAAPAAAEDGESSMQALLDTLRDRGVIDEAEHAAISAKNSAYEARREDGKLPALSFWGDLRGRYEGFWFRRDATGGERDDRHRLRYRARLNLKADVNEHVDVFVRVSSGADDPRSANQTLGSALDFDSDPIRLERAYVELTPFRDAWDAKLRFGKVPNPFRWSVGKDFMLWDGDIQPEGASATLRHAAGEDLELFATGGYFVIDENSGRRDPHLAAVQVGAHARRGAKLRFGGRASFYAFGSLDAPFLERAASSSFDQAVTSGGGNILDGLTGSPDGGDLRVVELGAYLSVVPAERWPVTLYGTVSRNLDAEAGDLVAFPVTPAPITGLGVTVTTRGADQEDTAWGIGVEVGRADEVARLGFGYWQVEANAFPSQLVDSNLHDGRTNRRGFAAYAGREIWEGTQLNLTLFGSDELEDLDDLPDASREPSVEGAERLRLQADVVVRF